MSLMPFDFFLAFVLVIVLPLWAMQSFRRLKFGVEQGEAGARRAAYTKVIVVQWSLIGFLILHWILRARDFAELGFAFPLNWQTGVATLVALAAAIVLWILMDRVPDDDEASRATLEQLENLRFMLPHSSREWSWFQRVAVTAGTCEEILYRGFMPWLLAAWMPEPVAFAAASIIFGLGHAYQGGANVLKTAILGLILAALVWWTGSLVPAILIHIAIDWINGRLSYRLLARPSTAPQSTRPPEEI